MTVALEAGVVFRCKGETLVGVLHRAEGSRGVLVLVGGPQYRAGSHRQFTLLGRRLAAAGVPVLRFDCRGYGDSSGARADFEHVQEDVDAAITAFVGQTPGLREIVLWALCDAASAMLLHSRLPSTVCGLVLLNPWVRETEPAPATMLRHYYLRRLMAPDFWRKVVSGRVGASSLGELLATFAGAAGAGRKAADGSPEDRAPSLSTRMAAGLERFPGHVLLITSGRDLVAAEFLDTARREPRWQALLAQPRLRHEHLADANHTFARQEWRRRVEDLTLEWLRQW